MFILHNLTTNRMMTLLAIYRGSPVDEIRCGTTENDLRHLYKIGYIEGEGDNLKTTSAGTFAVVFALSPRHE